MATSAKKKEPKEKKPKEKKPAAARKPRKKKGVSEPGSRGIAAVDVANGAAPAEVTALERQIAADGGTVIGSYRDPLGGNWQVVAALPIEKVAPTPFQRDLSETHVGRLGVVLDKLDRFLDPIIAVRTETGVYWTPNGNHRLAAMTRLGAKAIVSLVVPDMDVAFRILALNTEKAHNLREKALEVIRMARSLAEIEPRAEKEYALEFEEPAFLTLGVAYEQRGRFSGGAYHSVLKKVDQFLDDSLPRALEVRTERAAKLLELDDAVIEAVAALKERGLTSPYLKAFVVSRVNFLRFVKGEPPSFEDTIERMLKSAKNFDASKIKADQVASTGGAPDEATE